MSTSQETQSGSIARSNLFTSRDVDSLCENVTKHIIQCAVTSIDKNDVFHFSLAGGSTPKVVYERLASPDKCDQIDWEKTHIWFGDERCVPPEHPDSNYQMASQALLSHVPVPESNIHRIAGELEPERAANDYADEMTRVIKRTSQGFPVFDLMLQGLGPDGHTASLFPGTPALEVNDCPVTSLYVEKMDSWRVSVTIPVLNAARNIMFLVAGTGKREIILDLFRRTDSKRRLYPVEMLNPRGRVDFFLDEEAASLIKGL